MSNFQLLRTYLRPYRTRLLLLGILILFSIGLQLISPQIIRQFLDAATAGESVQILVTLGIFFLFVVMAQKIISLVTVYFGEDLGWAATNSLRVDLTRHCLRLDMGFHKLRTPGELIERIDGDVSNLAEYFSQLVIEVFGNTLLVLGILFFLFREDWRFGLIGLVYALVTLGFLRLIQNPTVHVWRDVSQAYAEMHGYVEERIGGTEDVRANGAEQAVMNKLYPLLNEVAEQRTRASLLGGFTFTTSYMFYVLAIVITLGLAGLFFLQGQISIGTLFLLVFYVRLMETPIKYIRRQIGNLQKAFASISRINEFFKLEPQVKEVVTAVIPAKATAVSFEQVTFAYKDGLPASISARSAAGPGAESTSQPDEPEPQNVLQDISFQLQAGQVLGLLGRTGSGKTSMTRLLFRLYDIDTGAITLDGIDVRHVSLSDLRQHIGLVTQEVQLFEASIRDNLTLFRNYDPNSPPITDDEIMNGIEALGLESWLKNLPDGLDTMLKTGGQGLSAGEAQLLAFSRVFLRDPHLVILDEASSRLDPVTEQLLERAIDRLLSGRTGIIIAHRLGTVQRADDILILDHGRVQEHGERLLLANNPQSRFYHLLQTGLEEVLV